MRAVILPINDITDTMIRECIDISRNNRKDCSNNISDEAFNKFKDSCIRRNNNNTKGMLFWFGDKPQSLYGITEVADIHIELQKPEWTQDNLM